MSVPSVSSASSARPAENDAVSGEQTASPEIGRGGVPLWRSCVLLGLALLIGLAYVFNPPLDVQPQAGVVMELPVIVGDYLGKQGAITQVEYDLLPKDTEFARRFYDDSHGDQIACTIVLSGAEQRSIHRPEGCLTGQGWSIVGQDTIPVPMQSGKTMLARKLTLERQARSMDNQPITVRAFYIYWFVGNDVMTPSEFYRVLLSNWDRVMNNKAHRWAYVSVFSLITEGLEPNGLDPDQTETMLKNFTRQIVPTFQISEMPAQDK